jgi:hypothetical protein
VAEKRGGVVAAAHERLVAVERAADGRQSVLRKVREVFAARAGSRSVDHFDVGRVAGRSQADADENLSAVLTKFCGLLERGSLDQISQDRKGVLILITGSKNLPFLNPLTNHHFVIQSPHTISRPRE